MFSQRIKRLYKVVVLNVLDSTNENRSERMSLIPQVIFLDSLNELPEVSRKGGKRRNN